MSFKDPTGDDFGPGSYVYPNDPVYKKGSFDLTGLTVKQDGDQVTFTVAVNSDLEDPWAMPAPAAFSVQMAIIHVQTGKGGLVKIAASYAEVESKLREACRRLGLDGIDYFASAVTGGDGNREFFVRAAPAGRPMEPFE